MIGVNLWNRVVDPRGLRDRGASWVGRQLGEARGGLSLTPEEVEAIHGAGIGIVPMFLPDVVGIFFGRTSGRDDAEYVAGAIQRLDMPAEIPVFITVPFWPFPGEVGDVLAYLTGWEDVLSTLRLGVVGPAVLLDKVRAGGYASFGWLTWPQHPIERGNEGHICHQPELDPGRYGAIAVHDARRTFAGLWMPPGVDLHNPAGI